MIVSELIEWLKTMPQDAKVKTLEHYGNSGYYQQGGTCNVTDFTTEVEHQQWKDEGDESPVEYIYGAHFELSTFRGEIILQLGVTDK
jgi:hypothetical protein